MELLLPSGDVGAFDVDAGGDDEDADDDESDADAHMCCCFLFLTRLYRGWTSSPTLLSGPRLVLVEGSMMR